MFLPQESERQQQRTRHLRTLLVNEDHPSLFSGGGAAGPPINRNAKTTDMHHEYQSVSNYDAALHLFTRRSVKERLCDWRGAQHTPPSIYL